MISLGANSQELRSMIGSFLQMIGALNHFFIVFFYPFLLALSLPFMMIQFFTPLLCISLAYLIWMWYDWRSPVQGGYPSRFLQKLPVHRWFCKYFPITLHHTTDLPDDQNYLIGIHPHGIVCISAFAFTGNGTGIIDRSPNLNFHLCTLNPNFWIPIRREWFMLQGLISCAKESISYVLNRKHKGQVVVLVVGGAEEAMDAHPGQYILTLRDRKGFVKIALETGAQLIPCFAFGENEVYEQASNKEAHASPCCFETLLSDNTFIFANERVLPERRVKVARGTFIRDFQSLVKRTFGFSPVLFHGRGIFNYNFGPLPHIVPLNTVLGAPINVYKTPSPTQQQVDDLHALYIDRLTELFEQNKERFGVARDNRLVIR